MAVGDEERIRGELRSAREQGRIHGAYLFEGSPGTGRRRTASWFARLLLCRAAAPDPCETCADCRKSAARAGDAGGPQHPDLHVVEPDGASLRVEQVRDLLRSLSLVPNEGGRRVGLLLGVERMNTQAANALLKTLEEPPATATLLLVTERAATLPRTVLSRTIQLRFRSEREPRVRQALEAEGLDAEDAWLAAALAGGSAATARAWADRHLEQAREMLRILETVEGLPGSELLDFTESFRGRGEALRERVELFLAVHAAVSRRQVEAATRGGPAPALSRWLDRAEAGARAQREWTRRNLNGRLVIEGLLFDLQRGLPSVPPH